MANKFYITTEKIKRNAIDNIKSLDLSKKFIVEIKPFKRSLVQNNLFHSWIQIMASESGATPEDMKRDVKRKVLGMKESTNALTGEITYTDYSTAKLTTEQFSRLMTHTQVIAGEFFGMTLPSPNDVPERLS